MVVQKFIVTLKLITTVLRTYLFINLDGSIVVFELGCILSHLQHTLVGRRFALLSLFVKTKKYVGLSEVDVLSFC